MPNVSVSHAASTANWSFDPPSLEMTASGAITFRKSDPNASWTFTGFSIKNSDTHQFRVVGSPGQTMVVQDDDTAAGTYQYEVCISTGECSDPQIINKV
jgi:hypothetical protein